MKRTYEDKVHILEALGFIVDERNPLLNTNHPGNYMVVQKYEASELPTKDGSNGPWCIVGNDLPALVEEAYNMWRPTIASQNK